MLVLAVVPGVSVLAVTARAAAFGFSHGLFTTLGIVVADLVFILVAVYGLALVATLSGDALILVQYLGAAYLGWLGISLWRSEARSRDTGVVTESSWLSSFLTGFLMTLGDQKAIFFYLGFLPAFVDLAHVTLADTLVIAVIATLGVGGAKLVYAFLAARASVLFRDTQALRWINRLAAVVMLGVGAVLLLKAGGWV